MSDVPSHSPEELSIKSGEGDSLEKSNSTENAMLDFSGMAASGLPAACIEELLAAREDLRKQLLKGNRRVAGFQRGPEELVKLENGELNEAAILRETYFECFHCGSPWKDDGEHGELRVGLDRSSFYVAARPEALPGRFGFNFPQWINRRLPWGPMMLAKLKAAEVARKTGNYGPLRIWWQKVAGRIWDESRLESGEGLSLAVGSYEGDPAKCMPNFHSRNMAVDCQKALDAGPKDDRVGSFWYMIRENDVFGNSRQLERGFARSWEEWIARQKFWKVPNARVVIDSSKWTPAIMTRAALEFELVTPAVAHPLTGRKDPFPSCWRLFFGDEKAEFKVKDKLSSFSPPQQMRSFTVTSPDGRKLLLWLFKYRWSNLAFEMQLEAILAGGPGMPRFEVLPREALSPEMQAKETGILTYEQQMGARYLHKSGSKRKYEDLPNREAHYRDLELMLLVRAAQDGLLGHLAVDANGEETEEAKT